MYLSFANAESNEFFNGNAGANKWFEVNSLSKETLSTKDGWLWIGNECDLNDGKILLFIWSFALLRFGDDWGTSNGLKMVWFLRFKDEIISSLDLFSFGWILMLKLGDEGLEDGELNSPLFFGSGDKLGDLFISSFESKSFEEFKVWSSVLFVLSSLSFLKRSALRHFARRFCWQNYCFS
mgnify:CR=1 FL=1